MNDDNRKEELEELFLIEHELDQTEHRTILHSLKTFMSSLVAPIGVLPAVAVKSAKRQSDLTADLLNSLSGYNKELCITDSELSILKKALKYFVSTPANNLKNIKQYQNAAVSLLKEFETVNNDD